MHRLFPAVVALSCLAIGCSGGGDSIDRAEDDRPSAVRPAEPVGRDAPAELTLASGGPTDQRLRLAMVRPGSYVPSEVVLTDQAGVIVADLLYDGLTEAVGSEGRLRPGLALKWAADEDFTTWTFALDPAAGVTASHVAGSLAPLSAAGREGSGRASGVAVLAAGIESISTDGPLTVTIELRSSNAGLPWILSGLPYSIVGPDGAATGDFEAVSDDVDGMILRRRVGHGAPSGLGPEEIHVSWAATAADAYDRLTSAEADAAVVDLQSFTDARSRYGAETVATAATRFYVMNSRSDTLTEASVRRAVLAAVDRTELVDVGFAQQVVGIDGLIGPTLAGYTEAAACGDICANDPPLAAAVVAQMTIARLQVSYAGDDQAALASIIVDRLTAAGFEAEHTRLQPGDLASVIVAGETDLFAFGWVAPATSIDAVIPPLLTVDSAANIARVDSAEVADLLARAAVTADDGLRWQIMAEAHRQALAEALIMPIAASTSMLVGAPGMQPLSVRADGSIDLESTD